jgi:hypothetical protein
MRLLHSAKDTSAQFDDPNLVSCAGLVPVMRLAQDCDLAGLVAEHLKMVAVGVNAHLKILGSWPACWPGRTPSTTSTCCATAG